MPTRRRAGAWRGSSASDTRRETSDAEPDNLRRVADDARFTTFLSARRPDFSYIRTSCACVSLTVPCCLPSFPCLTCLTATR
jgi:hypothetical protein